MLGFRAEAAAGIPTGDNWGQKSGKSYSSGGMWLPGRRLASLPRVEERNTFSDDTVRLGTRNNKCRERQELDGAGKA